MKAKPLAKISAKEPVRVESLNTFATPPKALKRALAHPKEFKAGVVLDKHGLPRYFVFDTYSLWDFLCAIDEQLETHTSDRTYVFRNPVGWLIDAIEAHLPINPKLASRLKKGVDEAKRLGVVPFERIKRELGLA